MEQLIRSCKNDYRQRTAVITLASFSLNALMGVGKLVLGVILFSPWLIVSSVYYIVLSLARGQALRSFDRNRTITDKAKQYNNEFEIYKKGGVLICFLAAAYAAVCLRMYFVEDPIIYKGSIVLIIALIAFIKVGVAIFGMIKTRGLNSPIISVVKKLNFIDAIVAIVITQCAILTMQGSEHAVSSSVAFGLGCSLLFFSLGVVMIIKKE